DDGTALVESSAILDYLDEVAGPAKALIPASGRGRRDALRVCALASGLADTTVSLLYERVLRKGGLQRWIDRCTSQISGVLDMLAKDRAGRARAYWFGPSIGHADIAVACALRLTREAHPTIYREERWPALHAHAAACEALPPFQEIVQPLSPPKS